MSTKILKQIVFSEELNRKAVRRAAKLGITVPEYIRHLVVCDTEEIEYITDEDIIEGVEEAEDDLVHGRYETFKNSEEVNKSLLSLKDGNSNYSRISKKVRKADKKK